MEDAIQLLYRNGNSKEVRTSIETLIKIFRNIVQNPEDQKYKCLKLSNSTFFKTVWRYDGARHFLLKAGWKAKGNEIIFEDSSKLDAALKVLLSKRTISPENDEWTGEVIQGPSKQQLRETELREKAIMQRDKEIEDIVRSREERRKITEYIKAEHIADRKWVKTLRPSMSSSETEEDNVTTEGS